MMAEFFRRAFRLVFPIVLGGGTLLLMVLGLARPTHAGAHCRDLPTPFPEWCGCTWGSVYYNGKPVSGAQITVTFGSKQITATTRISLTKDGTPYAEGYPYYDLRVSDTGARYGDVVTFTVSYRGEVLTRALRMLPTGNYTTAEQEISMAFPRLGQWGGLANSADVKALAAQGDTLWVGTESKLIRLNMSSGISQPVNIGLPAAEVHAIAVGQNGDVWVGAANGLSRFKNGTWTPQTTGLPAANATAIAIGNNGDVWVGAGSSVGTTGVSRFISATQSWQRVTGLEPAQVQALVVDSNNHLWVGSNNGAHRFDGTRWYSFTVAEGLPTDDVSGLAAEPGAVWLTTRVQGTGPDTRYGTATRYDLATNTWKHYTATQELASKNIIRGVALDAAGRKWFATDNGISLFDDQNWFTYRVGDGLRTNNINVIAACSNGLVCAGSAQGIDRFAPVLSRTLPVVTALSARQTGDVLTLTAAATDTHPGNVGIISYDWRSNVNGLLGSERSYEIRVNTLASGTHIISVQAMNDEGAWSAPITTTLQVTTQWRIFLPMVMKPTQGLLTDVTQYPGKDEYVVVGAKRSGTC
jgi:hypothetical protein